MGYGDRFKTEPEFKASRTQKTAAVRQALQSDMLTGQNYVLERYINCGGDTRCYRVAEAQVKKNPREQILRLQQNTEGMYPLPIGAVISLRGANRQRGYLSPAQAIMHIPRLPVVVTTAPDPFGEKSRLSRGTTRLVMGRAFYVSNAARTLLVLAGRTGRGGRFYDWASPSEFLNQWFSPKVQAEITEMANANIKAADDIATVAEKNQMRREKQARIDRQKDEAAAASGGAPGLPPAVWAAAAVGGLYLWRQKK